MVTVLRVDGLRIAIFVNDHAPAHVHVFADGEAKIDLVGPDGAPALVWADNMTKTDVRRAIRAVEDRRSMLLAKWDSIHGRTDRR